MNVIVQAILKAFLSEPFFMSSSAVLVRVKWGVYRDRIAIASERGACCQCLFDDGTVLEDVDSNKFETICSLRFLREFLKLASKFNTEKQHVTESSSANAAAPSSAKHRSPQ